MKNMITLKIVLAGFALSCVSCSDMLSDLHQPSGLFPPASPRPQLIGDVRITNQGNTAFSPSLVWTGSEFGLSWSNHSLNNEQVYFTRVSAAGEKQGIDIPLTDQAANANGSSLVWADTGYGIAWVDTRDENQEIYFTRLDQAGLKQGLDVRVSVSPGSSYNVSCVWTGFEFCTAWEDWRIDPTPFTGNSEIYFHRMATTGARIGTTDSRLTNAESFSGIPSLAWAGSQYGVAWTDHRDSPWKIHFTRFSSTGTKIGSDICISNHDFAYDPCLVWTGTEYGLAWYDSIPGNPGFTLLFVRLSATGEKMGAELTLQSELNPGYGPPSLVWNGTEYAVAWSGYADGNLEIFFTRIAATGNLAGSMTRVTTSENTSYFPSLAWAGDGYGVAWTDHRDLSGEIYFALLGPDGTKR
ncbi:MAG: hypothetical protein EHM28_08830 [Spirochaetaceae bacterium]|nr:MAG: hypothetical protein EHM28_08830 [Spirochaetaceae bacterium]